MNYLRQLFNTPFNLWTVGQEAVFTLMFFGALVIIFVAVGFLYWIMQKIKSYKHKKCKEKKDGDNSI